jgi:hypothetical protein
VAELSRASGSKGPDRAKRGRPGGHWEARAAVLLFPSRARVNFRLWSRGQACSVATLLEGRHQRLCHLVISMRSIPQGHKISDHRKMLTPALQLPLRNLPIRQEL